MAFSLRALLDRGAADSPDAVVLVEDGVELTWTGLRRQSRGVAHALVRDGVTPGQRVVYVGKNGLAFFPFLFGCALAGAVATPVSWRLGARELADIADDTGAEVLVVDAELTGLVEELEARLPRVRRVVTLAEEHPRWTPWREWSSVAEDPCAPPAPDDVAVQLYTSGTTGRPKGAMFTNATNLRVLAEDIAPAWGLSAADTSLLCMPLFHMGGVAWALAGMARGVRGVVVRDFVPDAVLRLMEVEQVTTAFFVPAMLAALCAAPGLGDRDLALRRLVYSGSPISTTALARAMATFRCDFLQIYGLTEATGAFAQLPPADHAAAGREAGLLRSAGRPYPWVEVRVVDPATGGECVQGAVGEVWTRSEQNTLGYWRQPEATAQAITADGWLRTGDLGYLDADGRIFLVDRAKDLIISGGENVYPAEVENELAACPGIAEVAVIGVPDERWGETVKAVVVGGSGHNVAEADVIAFAKTRLAGFKCPTSVDVVERLPRTATGKVLKTELRDPYWQGYDRGIN